MEVTFLESFIARRKGGFSPKLYFYHVQPEKRLILLLHIVKERIVEATFDVQPEKRLILLLHVAKERIAEVIFDVQPEERLKSSVARRKRTVPEAIFDVQPEKRLSLLLHIAKESFRGSHKGRENYLSYAT